MKKHIPNTITILRIALIPVFIYFMLKHDYLIAGLLFILAGMSDMLDGFLARKLKVVSDFGKLMDPLADKCIQITAILLLCIVGKLHYFFAIILIIKEYFMIRGSYLLYKNNIVAGAVWFGKVATLMLNSSIAAVLIFNLSNFWVNLFIGISMIVELISLLLYTKRYFVLKKQLESDSKTSNL